MRKSNLIIFILLISLTTGYSQFVLTPIKNNHEKKNAKPRGGRTGTLTPMFLPFWDDFSFSNSKSYPNDTLWQYGKSVNLNLGDAINPPTLGVVTFDGLDSIGKPYSINDPLVKGYADSLVSRAIRLDTVPASQRDSVFLSFFYEPTGNGETPDPGDNFVVDFKNRLGQWETVALIANDGTLRSDTFNIVMLPIDSSKFFHNNFQFRFRNYGRLSGPYDTWHLDYVYLNSHRSTTDTSFPDRAVSTPMTTLLDEYWSIPKKHFLNNINGNLNKPSLEISNLSNNVVQVLDYLFNAQVISYIGNSSDTASLHVDSIAAPQLSPLSRGTITIATAPPPNFFDPAADSFKINLQFGLHSGDNALPPVTDYDSVKFSPIDFRRNDSTRVSLMLSNYYAYDDGSAEYGIGLNQPGAQAAYKFDMKTSDPDTVVAVDIYFPHFGDETNQILQLNILSDTTNGEQFVLYQENIQVNRSEMDTLRRYKLNVNTVGVQGHFYISWKQSSAVSIPIGWDRNTDSGDKIFFNLNGYWEQNITEHGSIMMHPVFGRGGVVTGIPELEKPIHAYPNPNAGTFYLSGEPDYLEIVDLAGKPLSFSRETIDHQTRVELTNAYPGIYILKAYLKGKYSTTKIMVRP